MLPCGSFTPCSARDGILYEVTDVALEIQCAAGIIIEQVCLRVQDDLLHYRRGLQGQFLVHEALHCRGSEHTTLILSLLDNPHSVSSIPNILSHHLRAACSIPSDFPLGIPRRPPFLTELTISLTIIHFFTGGISQGFPSVSLLGIFTEE